MIGWKTDEVKYAYAFFLAVNVNRKEYLENVGVVRIVILEWIFQKPVVNLLTE